MLCEKSIKDMYIHFTEIINNFKYLRKTYTNEKVRKVLWYLSIGKWRPEVMAIEEAQNLKPSS